MSDPSSSTIPIAPPAEGDKEAVVAKGSEGLPQLQALEEDDEFEEFAADGESFLPMSSVERVCRTARRRGEGLWFLL